MSLLASARVLAFCAGYLALVGLFLAAFIWATKRKNSDDITFEE